MGMRQNIKLVYSKTTEIKSGGNDEEVNALYIYSHWGGGSDYQESSLAQSLYKAISRHKRWDDESYLARIIISEVLRLELDDATGYGIAPYEVDPEFPTIVVDLVNNTVDGEKFDDWIKKFTTKYI